MKKLWIITGIILVVGIIAVVFLMKKNTTKPEITSATQTPIPTPAPELTTWNDEAGFSFQYPKNLSTNKHEEDNDSYAHVELTQAEHPGKVIVWVKDLPSGVTTLASWVKKAYPDATTLDTKLGGEPAKKILVTAPVKMLIVGTISDNLLFYVEGTLTDNEYWTSIHDTISESFKFTDDTSTAAVASGPDATGGDFDEEEVVQ